MQITNNTTTINLNEEKLLNLIIDQRIVRLEKIIAAHYNCNFNDVPKKAYNAHLYLCLVDLGLKANEIADIYDISYNKLQRILLSCHTKMKVNNEYRIYLYSFHLSYLKQKITT